MLFCIGLKLGLLLLWKMIENVENKNILEKIHEDVSYALLSTMPWKRIGERRCSSTHS